MKFEADIVVRVFLLSQLSFLVLYEVTQLDYILFLSNTNVSIVDRFLNTNRPSGRTETFKKLVLVVSAYQTECDNFLRSKLRLHIYSLCDLVRSLERAYLIPFSHQNQNPLRA